MDWSASTLWWAGAACLVAAELATGTFYLLMLAAGAAAAALAAHAGLALSGQLLAGAAVGGGAVVAWYLNRSRLPSVPSASSNPDVNLDIGSKVHVTHWGPDGSARVTYRGAGWDARFVGNATPSPGDFVIRAVEGSCLILDQA